MYRWTVEYIAENTERWDKERIEREKERKEAIQEWDKKSRIQKIRTLKEMWNNKTQGKKETQQEKKEKIDKWSIWREKEQTVIEIKTEMKENTNQEKKEGTETPIYPIFLTMREPKIKMKEKEKKNNVKTKEKKQKPNIKTNSKETEKCSRAMRAWLSTSTCGQNSTIAIENSRDGAGNQPHEMAIQGDDSNHLKADQSDYGQDCHVTSENENINTNRSEMKSNLESEGLS